MFSYVGLMRTRPLNLCPHALVMYIRFYIADMRMKEVSKCTVGSEQSSFVKIANNNISTLCGFRWYSYFGTQLYVLAQCRASK